MFRRIARTWRALRRRNQAPPRKPSVQPTPAPRPPLAPAPAQEPPAQEPPRMPTLTFASPRQPGETVKHTIYSVLSAFETGDPLGSPGTVAVLNDGAGISYGMHQATDGGGTLDAIVQRYADVGGAFGDQLLTYLPALEDNETTAFGSDKTTWPDWLRQLVALLETAGTDPVMRQVQEEVFDARYWVPALAHIESMKLELPLSMLVVYDTCIQSGPDGVNWMRRRFPELPPARGGDERAWTQGYLRARRAWLASSARQDVRDSVYRIDSLQALLDQDRWDLVTPFHLLRPSVVIQ